MIFIVYGTTAEYVKLLPLIGELKVRKACVTIALAQQECLLADLFRRYPDLPAPDLWLVHGRHGRDLDRFSQVPLWFGKAAVEIARSWRTVRRAADPIRTRNLWIVHGDTFTTVFGAVWGRLLGYTVGHVEAGLRSRSLLHPFPEEIDRLLVTRLARIHFAPGADAVANLTAARGDVIDTHVNTSHDSIDYARTRPSRCPVDLPDRFGIVSLHRTELVKNRPVLERTLRTLAEYAVKVPLVFIEHPLTMTVARDEGFEHLLRDLICVPKLDYFAFVKMLERSSFVVTDSGGLQEDCAYLKKPCLVVRKATERRDGIAEGIVHLSRYRDERLRRFLDDPEIRGKAAVPTTGRPVATIIDYLEDRGLIGGRSCVGRVRRRTADQDG